MFDVQLYRPENQAVWDSFLSYSCVNPHFQFQRSYIDYPGRSLDDISLIVSCKSKIVALFPACLQGNIVYSHRGLAYGGICYAKGTTIRNSLEIWNLIKNFYLQARIENIIIRPLPFFLKNPDFQRYALITDHAELIRTEPASVLDLSNPKKNYQRRRIRGWKKADKCGVIYRFSDDWSNFWVVLQQELAFRHGAKPVHSAEQITYLANHFPNNIRLAIAEFDGEIVAGVVVFKEGKTSHAQYIISNEKGRTVRALDGLMVWLIEQLKNEKQHFFSLGTSTLPCHQTPDWKLLEWKEGWRTVPYLIETYKVTL